MIARSVCSKKIIFYLCLEFRRSSGVDSESDSSSTISGEEKDNALVWQRSKSLDALVDGGGDVFAGQDQLATANEVNGGFAS